MNDLGSIFVKTNDCVLIQLAAAYERVELGSKHSLEELFAIGKNNTVAVWMGTHGGRLYFFKRNELQSGMMVI